RRHGGLRTCSSPNLLESVPARGRGRGRNLVRTMLPQPLRPSRRRMSARRRADTAGPPSAVAWSAMSAPRPSLFDFPIEDLPLPDGVPAYRRRQLAAWLYRRGVLEADAFEDAMTDLPVALRAWWRDRYVLDPFSKVERFGSDDGSVR